MFLLLTKFIICYFFTLELKPEPCPKWNALNEILNEISIQINKEQNPSESAKKVLILVNDGRMAAQLKNFLTMGAGEYLLYEAMKSLSKNELLKPRSAKFLTCYSIFYISIKHYC